MRDLARQNYQSRDRIAVPQSAVRILLLLAALLVVLFGVKLITSGSGLGGSSITLRDAPRGLTPVAVITGAGVVTEDSVNLIVESASFTNVSGGSAGATATRKYGDGSYSLSVNATLPNPLGNRYQVWIVGGGQQFLAGDMSGSGGTWSIVFNDVDNYSDLGGIWITREITNNDNRPETHILEGSFE